MLIHVLIVLLVGLVLVVYGCLVFTEKMPMILHLFVKLEVSYYDRRTHRIFGCILIIIGLFIMILPFILGTENMNF